MSMNQGAAQQATHPDHVRMSNYVEEMLVLTSGNQWLGHFVHSFKAPPERQGQIAKKMKKELRRESPGNKRAELFSTLPLLSRCPPEAFDLPTNPLRIALEFVDPSVLSGPKDGGSDGSGSTPLHWVCEMSDPFDALVNANQVRIATILLDAGANVNAPAEHLLRRITPLHRACHSAIATNLDLIRLLLDRGANPNAKNDLDETPLMHSLANAASAALFVLEHCDEEVVNTDIVNSRGWTVLGMVRDCMKEAHGKMVIAPPPYREQLEHLLMQQRDLESALVARGAADAQPGM